jgi:hypothetical protein
MVQRNPSALGLKDLVRAAVVYNTSGGKKK